MWTAKLCVPKTAAKLDAVISCEDLNASVCELLEYQPNDKSCRPALPAVIMLKRLFLAKWFGLSGPQLEENLLDRLSFRHFVGLSLQHETSYWRFRSCLHKKSLRARRVTCAI